MLINKLEIIAEVGEEFLKEGFKAQRAPKSGPSKDKFQRKMKKRLSKAHRTYLTTGAGPRGHHGGGFRLDPKLGGSNAFLAEEEIEEISDLIPLQNTYCFLSVR